MRWMAGFAGMTTLVAGMVIGGARPANACSCSQLSLDQAIFDADYVFIGTPRSVAPIESGTFADLAVMFDVSSVLSGNIGPTVDVLTSVQETSCGDGPDWAKPPLPTDEVAVVARSGPGGVILSDEGTCSASVTPDGLRDLLATELPTATSTEPIAALVPFRNAWGAVAALDEQGELVAWAGGTGTPWRIASCPDAAYAVESLPKKLRVRDLSTMAVEATFKSGGARWAELYCLGYNDGAVETLQVRRPEPDGALTLVRKVNGEAQRTLEISGQAVVLDRQGNRAVVLPKRAGKITAVDLDTFETTPLTGADNFAATVGALSNDRRLVVVTTSVRVEVYDVAGAALTLLSSFAPELPDGYVRGVSWQGDAVVLEISVDNETLIARFTADGTELNRFVIQNGTAGLVVGDLLLSRSGRGELNAYPLDGTSTVPILSTGSFDSGPAMEVLVAPAAVNTSPVGPSLRRLDEAPAVPATSTVTGEVDKFSEEIAAAPGAAVQTAAADSEPAQTGAGRWVWPAVAVLASLAAAFRLGFRHRLR